MPETFFVSVLNTSSIERGGLRMRGKFVLAYFSMLLVSSQSAQGAVMHSYPVRDDIQNVKRGFYYSLPKTIIKGTVKYNLYKVIEFADEEKTEPLRRSYVCLIEEPIALNYSIARDRHARFRVDTKRLRSFTVNTDADFTLDENNILIGVNTTLEDRTGEIIESLAATSGNVAKMIALAAAPLPSPVKAIEYKLLGTHTQNFEFDLEDDVLKGSAANLGLSQPTSCVNTISKIVSDDSVVQGLMQLAVKDGGLQLEMKRMLMPQFSIDVDVPKSLFDCPLNAESIEKRYNDHWTAKIPFFGDNGRIPGAILRSPKNLKVKYLMCYISVPMSEPNLDGLTQGNNGTPPETVNVVAANNPGETTVALRGNIAQYNLSWFDDFDRSKRRIIFVENKPFLQYGDVSVIPITSGLFTKRTYGVTVSANGAVTKVHITSDSRGEKIAKTLEKVSEKVSPMGELIKTLSAKGGAK